MPTVTLSKKQTARVAGLVSAFISRGVKSPAMKPEFLLMLKTISKMIEDKTPFDQVELDIITYLLENYFNAFEKDDIDPQAEQAYAKIAGHWYEGFDEPYYDRCITYAHVVGYVPKKASRTELDKLGY